MIKTVKSGGGVRTYRCHVESSEGKERAGCDAAVT